ncbi:hypothetical protein EMIT0194MI4_30310 [Pseudomonas sp. IT-194MI4]
MRGFFTSIVLWEKKLAALRERLLTEGASGHAPTFGHLHTETERLRRTHPRVGSLGARYP